VRFTGTGSRLELNRAGFGRAVKWYSFVFRTEMLSTYVWKLIE
jgi:hypothetical protein